MLIRHGKKFIPLEMKNTKIIVVIIIVVLLGIGIFFLRKSSQHTQTSSLLYRLSEKIKVSPKTSITSTISPSPKPLNDKEMEEMDKEINSLSTDLNIEKASDVNFNLQL